jgi:hypothetical protein
MIRINLLKEPSPRQRIPARIPPGIFVALAVGALGTAGWFYGRPLLRLLAKPQKPAGAASVVKSEEVSPPVAPAPISGGGIVEDVVQDIHEVRDVARRSGVLNVSYEDLSFGERVNFEAEFASKCLDLLVRVVPEGIGLRSVEIDNFQTIYAIGLGSKEPVEAVFSSLRKEDIRLLPKPYTFIKPNQGGGYRFAFSCTAAWGLDLSDPLADITLKNVPLRNSLPLTIKQIAKIAAENSLTIKTAPRQESAIKIGGYRQFTYGFTARSSFADFVRFINSIRHARIQCAFKRINLTAVNASNIAIDAVILLTTLE